MQNGSVFEACSASVSASFTLSGHVRSQTLAMYYGVDSALAMNPMKGVFGENLLSTGVLRGVLEPSGNPWTSLTPHRVGGTGIDSLFLRTSRDGRPTSLMVGEAKYGSSRLGLTRDGRQMSGAWVRPRLAQTARDYAAAAEALRECRLLRGAEAVSRPLVVPLPGGGYATVAIQGDHAQVRCHGSGQANLAVIERQLRRTADFLRAAAEGRRPYRARLLRVAPDGRRFDITVEQLDRETGKATGHFGRIRGRFDSLPREMRNLVREAFASGFRDLDLHEEHVQTLADEACRDPSVLSRIRPDPRTSLRIGFDRGMALAAVAGAMLATLMQIGTSLLFRQDIRWGRVAKVAVLSAAGAAIGYYVGAQVHTRLVTTQLGNRIMALLPLRSASGSVAGGFAALGSGVAAGLLVAAGAWALGLVDAREAGVMAISSTAGAVAGVAFTSGAFGVAFAFGTASTGTAISALSGAAATNAALAWIGGGSIAAGGGGVVVGGAILAGGAAVVAIGVGIGISYAAKKLKEAERRRLVEGRMEITARFLAAAR